MKKVLVVAAGMSLAGGVEVSAGISELDGTPAPAAHSLPGFSGGVPEVCTEPVRPWKPYRMWYHPHGWTHDPNVFLYANFENSGTDAYYWTARCAAAAKWAYGPSQGSTDPLYYRNQCRPYSGGFTYQAMACDEWPNSTPPSQQAWAEGVVQAKAEWPWLFISIYGGSAQDPTIKPLLESGDLDLVCMESYTYIEIPGLNGIGLSGVIANASDAAASDHPDKVVQVIGHVMAGMGEEHLKLMTAVAHDYNPRAPGICFYGINDGDEGTGRMTRMADELSNTYFGDDVLFIDGFESGRFLEGRWTSTGFARVSQGFTWQENDVDVPWTGGSFLHSGAGTDATVPLASPGLVSLDLTDIAEDWLVDGYANRGLIVRYPTAGPQADAAFHSTESSAPDKRPKLTLEFEGAPAMTKTPVHDGHMHDRVATGYWSFTMDVLLVKYNPGWAVGCAYLWFDLDDVPPAQALNLTSATLTLEATHVLAGGGPLHVARIHENNINTEPAIEGADARHAARLLAGASLKRDISTAGRANGKLEYMYDIVETAAADGLIVEWYDGSSWYTANHITGATGGFVRGEDSLPLGAGGNENFAIRFSAATGAEARVYIDLVRVTGEISRVLSEVTRAPMDDVLCLSFESMSDVDYRLEHTEDVTETNGWNTTEWTVSGNGDVRHLFEPNSPIGAVEKIYRLVVK